MEYLKLVIIHLMSEQMIKIGIILTIKGLMNLIYRIWRMSVLEGFKRIRLEMIRIKRKMLMYCYMRRLRLRPQLRRRNIV